MHARSRLSGRPRESGDPGSLSGVHGSRLSARCAGVGRDDRGGAKDQPVAVRNDVWVGLPVSGLFFTGNRATPTCRAVSRPVGPLRRRLR
jgi:hypothetical protein